MPTLKFTTCRTVEEMLPNLALLREMYPDLDRAKYQAMLPAMVAKGYVQIVISALLDAEPDTWQPAGIVAYWIIPRLWVGGNTLDLDNFVILPAFRSSGIGSQVIQHVEEVAKAHGCSHVVLDAYVSNHKAAKFYTRHDYVQKGFHYVKPLTTES
jgi:ribosomal protein S18 acetylase RimI-like enzyme